MSELALAGTRVLDIASLYPAPLLAAMLGDHGADVVKVEPVGGDPLRAFGPGVWAYAARNKRSVELDLNSADGVELLTRLSAASDVIVLNQPVAVATRWRCSDVELLARNPRAIVVHVSAFGSSGPYAGRAGNGSVAEAMAGMPGLPVPVGDVFGATSGVVGVLAALYWRDVNGGSGQVIDVSLFEAVLPLVATRLAGGTSGTSVRTTVRTIDGSSLTIAATTDAQRERLAAATAGDPTAWAAQLRSHDAVAALVEARVPVAVEHDATALPADPHVGARLSVTEIGGVVMPAPAPRLSESPASIRRAAPGLGEHTDEVVEEWLDGS